MKSRSRRELIDENKRLKYENDIYKRKIELLDRNYEKLKDRFRAMGSAPDIEYKEGIHVVTAEIKPMQYGSYIYYAEDSQEDNAYFQNELVKQIVKGLMDQDIVQFIYHEADFFSNGFPTIGAKLFVIPWEMALKKPIKWNSVEWK